MKQKEVVQAEIHIFSGSYNLVSPSVEGDRIGITEGAQSSTLIQHVKCGAQRITLFSMVPVHINAT